MPDRPFLSRWLTCARQARPPRDPAGRARDARSDGGAGRVRRVQPLAGARVTGSAAHDDPDRRPDRDAGRTRRAGALGVPVQHLLHPGPRRRGDRRGPDGTPDDPKGIPVFAWKGETLEEYWWCTERRSPGRTRTGRTCSWTTAATPAAAGAGAEFEAAGEVQAAKDDDPEEWRVILSVLTRWPRRRASGPRPPTRSRASPRRPRPACARLYEMANAGADYPGGRRQRLMTKLEADDDSDPPIAGGHAEPRYPTC